MGVLGPVVEVLRAAMGHRRQYLAVSDLIAGQLVGHQHARHVAQALEQLAEKPCSRHRVAARLHEDVEHVAVLVDRAPQIMSGAVDLHEHLVEVPFVAGTGSPTTSLGGVVRPELGTPGPDRLGGDHDAAGEHQFLDVAQAQRETVIQPHRVPDDLDRIPVALVPRRNRHKRPILAAPHQVNNLTMPSGDLWVPGSRRYTDPTTLLMPTETWAAQRDDFCAVTGADAAPTRRLQRLEAELHTAVTDL